MLRGAAGLGSTCATPRANLAPVEEDLAEVALELLAPAWDQHLPSACQLQELPFLVYEVTCKALLELFFKIMFRMYPIYKKE